MLCKLHYHDYTDYAVALLAQASESWATIQLLISTQLQSEASWIPPSIADLTNAAAAEPPHPHWAHSTTSLALSRASPISIKYSDSQV